MTTPELRIQIGEMREKARKQREAASRQRRQLEIRQAEFERVIERHLPMFQMTAAGGDDVRFQ